MAFIQSAVEWSKATFLPLGPFGLFIVAFMESSFLPIPPDLLIIALVLIDKSSWWFFAIVATAGSVLGAFLGYYIGMKGGRPVLNKLAGKKKTEKVQRYFDRYGNWAIGIAGFTPIPYKIFTIAAGVFRHNIWHMTAVSIISRGARFLLVAAVVMLWGEEIIMAMDNYIAALTALMIIGIGGYVFYKMRLKK